MKKIYIVAAILLTVSAVGLSKAAEADSQDHQQKMRELEYENRKAELQTEIKRQQILTEAIKAGIINTKEKNKQAASYCPRQKYHHCKGMFLIFLISIVVHILLAIWTYKDTKKTGVSGIWVAVVLLTGLFGVIPYAIVRLYPLDG